MDPHAESSEGGLPRKVKAKRSDQEAGDACATDMPRPDTEEATLPPTKQKAERVATTSSADAQPKAPAVEEEAASVPTKQKAARAPVPDSEEAALPPTKHKADRASKPAEAQPVAAAASEKPDRKQTAVAELPAFARLKSDATYNRSATGERKTEGDGGQSAFDLLKAKLAAKGGMAGGTAGARLETIDESAAKGAGGGVGPSMSRTKSNGGSYAASEALAVAKQQLAMGRTKSLGGNAVSNGLAAAKQQLAMGRTKTDGGGMTMGRTFSTDWHQETASKLRQILESRGKMAPAAALVSSTEDTAEEDEQASLESKAAEDRAYEELSRVQGQIRKAEQEVKELEAEKEEARGKLAALEGVRQGLQGEIGEAEHVNTSLQLQLKQLEGEGAEEVAALKFRLTTLRDAVQSHSAAADAAGGAADRAAWIRKRSIAGEEMGLSRRSSLLAELEEQGDLAPCGGGGSGLAAEAAAADKEEGGKAAAEGGQSDSEEEDDDGTEDEARTLRDLQINCKKLKAQLEEEERAALEEIKRLQADFDAQVAAAAAAAAARVASEEAEKRKGMLAAAERCTKESQALAGQCQKLKAALDSS
eukprot:TRINITY_DN27688_c0_g2_i1.p1 TRINITY_DN27688_c0_g2~~TRINITY_DN27688_c0_g2_i1.p1  ORF type:complete len:590 (-),score=227.02 TRINITY_DN27688_c0_g2_i1:564-2333(-)